MKKTNEDLLKFFGLKVGDKVRVDGYTTYFVIVIEDGKMYVKEVYENYDNLWGFLNFTSMLIAGYEYEVITPKKKLGEMKCGEMSCSKCPLRAIDCDITNNLTNNSMTLYEALERYRKYLSGLDDPLKSFEKTFIASIKAELDKEVQ